MSRILVVEYDEVLRNELIELLRNEGYEAEYISTFSDTAGQIIKSKPDLVLLDIKQIDEAEHIRLTGHSNKNILAFARYLDQKKKPVWIRHVVVPGITFEEAELTELGHFLKTLSNMEKLEVLPYHALGKVKYDNLGMDYVLKDTPQLTKEEAKKAEQMIRDAMS